MILALSSCHDDIPIYDSYETTTQTLFVYMPWTGSTTSSAYALNNFFDENIAGMKKYVDTSKGIKGTDIIVFKANSQSQSVMFRMKYNMTQQRCEFDTLRTNAGFVSVSEANLESLLNLVTALQESTVC